MRRMFLIITILLTAFAGSALSQDDNVYDDMSLAELANIDLVVTASKKIEDLFETPLSVTIVKREEILNSGAGSIPEALRLVPGMIVREQAPGVFDVHIRGFDNVTVNTTLPFPTNTITLVMIDNRPVYNYFAGGTFWETLPVDINDIDRIEIVRGPASALYGPNAVAGVINIISAKPEGEDLIVRSSITGGTESSSHANAYIGRNWNNGFAFSVSGNTLVRNRDDDKYYDWNRKDYTSIENITSIAQPDVRLIDRDGVSYTNNCRSINRQGFNTFLQYRASDRSSVELSTGYQSSDAQKIYVNNNATPFTQNSSQLRYWDVKGRLHGLLGQFSLTTGNQKTNEPLWDYDYTTMDANLEYEWKNKKWEIRPGISHRYADYDGAFVGEKALLNSMSLSLLTNYNATLKLRLIGGFRVDKFNFSNKYHITYEIGTTYRINKSNLVRFVHSRAARSPFMVDTFMDLEQREGGETYNYLGNKNKDLLTASSLEAGWRRDINPALRMDIEVFVSQLGDFSDLVYEGLKSDETGDAHYYKYQDIDYIAIQTGSTFSLQYKPSRKIHAGIFGTFFKYDFEAENEDIANDPFSVNESTTPDFYGGFSLGYYPMDALMINTDMYFTSHQEFNALTGKQQIPSAADLNCTISYALNKNIKPYVSFRNILGNHREYGFADMIGRTYFAGLHYMR